MSAILEGTPDKKLALVTGRAYPEQAQETAKYLGTDVLETTAYDFANGEMYVRYTEPVRGADAFVMQAHTEPINKWIMEQLIMIDALKRASARSITAVCPLLGYSRQDKKHRGREPISCRLVFDLLKTAGNGKSATVRYLSEKQIKIRYLFLHTAYKVAVSHCQLIKIAQHSIIEFVHFALSFSAYNRRD